MILLLGAALLCAPVLAQEPVPAAPPVDASVARGFADHLLSAQDPFNALTWYRLALYLDPARPDADAIRFRMAWAYEKGERYDAAEVAYGDLAGTSLASRAAYRSAAVSLLQEDWSAADQAFEAVTLYHPGTDWAARAAFARGITWLEANQLQRAATAFSQVPQGEGPWDERAATLGEQALAPTARRSPLLAASLSAVVPGAGQAYSGHVGDGVMALLANGVLGVWSYTLLRDGLEEDQAWETGMGSVIGAMFLVTWSSNVLGGWRSAERYQHTQARHRAEDLLQQAFDPELELQTGDVRLP